MLHGELMDKDWLVMQQKIKRHPIQKTQFLM
jgi:hypothetical protein